MSNYVIFTDTNADLPESMLREFEIEVIPFSFRIDEKDYVNYPDYRELSPKDFYDLVREGKMATTSMLNAYAVMEEFKPFLEQGKDVLYFSFSGALSGSCNQAVNAANMLMEEYSGRKVIVIDTLAASFSEGMIAYYAAIEKAKGKTITEVAEFAKSIVQKACVYVSVDDLSHLHRGGRLSAASAVVGSLLGIKPIIKIDSEGKLLPIDKVRGKAKAMEYLVDCFEKYGNPKEQILWIAHADDEEAANALAEMVKSRFKTQDIIINYVGPVVGTHTGPGTLAIFFLADQR